MKIVCIQAARQARSSEKQASETNCVRNNVCRKWLFVVQMKQIHRGKKKDKQALVTKSMDCICINRLEPSPFILSIL